MTAGPARALLGDGRLHFQHGPVDLLITIDGAAAHAEAAAEAMWRRFTTVLDELVAELAELRCPVADGASVNGEIALAMLRATVANAQGDFATPMIAVAGAVADVIADTGWRVAALRRVIVNNGGDVAVRLDAGQRAVVGVFDEAGSRDTALAGRLHLSAEAGIGGVATSGAGGRSLSLGIADAVTVLAGDAATADVVATLVANAVDLGDHPRIERRPAASVVDDSDLGDLPVTVRVGRLTSGEIDLALDAGERRAVTALREPGVDAVLLALRGRRRRVRRPAAQDALTVSSEWWITSGQGLKPRAASATDCSV